MGKLRRMTLRHACFQIILALLLPALTLKEREDISDFDPVYQVVTYIAQNFKKDISLLSMSQALGIGEYRLSRIFSSTFHQNFNHYLNEVRLNYVTSSLGDSDKQITEIALDSGFQSQATFNRVFRDRFHMTPREYRKMIQLEEKRKA
jgi:AraC-like DNA-binding protein